MFSYFVVPIPWTLALLTTTVFTIGYPFVLAAIAKRRLRLGWRYFWYGVLIFTLFQLITRAPVVMIVGTVFAQQIKSSQVLLYGWLALLVLTAALFEEVGRYVGYRWLMGREEKTWSKAVLYGIGHGGVESVVLVGLANLNVLVQLVAISAVGVNRLPPATQAQVAPQFAAIAAQPGWLPLLGGWERLWTLPIQVALSVLVVQVFRRGQIRWLLLAILGHMVVDGAAVGLQQALPAGVASSVIVEAVVAALGLVALWIIFALRDRATAASAPVSTTDAPVSMQH
jgi:uncharacterized membrane protein YhfC